MSVECVRMNVGYVEMIVRPVWVFQTISLQKNLGSQGNTVDETSYLPTFGNSGRIFHFETYQVHDHNPSLH